MENGILVKAGCEEELAQAMDFMLANPETAETMGQNALKIRKELDPDVIVGRWREYIDHQIARKASKRQEK